MGGDDQSPRRVYKNRDRDVVMGRGNHEIYMYLQRKAVSKTTCLLKYDDGLEDMPCDLRSHFLSLCG